MKNLTEIKKEIYEELAKYSQEAADYFKSKEDHLVAAAQLDAVTTAAPELVAAPSTPQESAPGAESPAATPTAG